MNQRNELQPPGAGLPGFERFVLRCGMTLASAFMSKSRALKKFKLESERIWELVDETDIPTASEQTLIPRLAGLEDSSRRWSLLMVMEHLCMVNADITKVIGSLHDGITPRGDLDIADYKPDPDVGLDVMDRFREINFKFDKLTSSKRTLRTVAKMRHPWFGPLNAHGWLCLAAIHQGMHRRQAQKIMALIGRV